MEACSLLVNLRERNAELELAAVSGEDRCLTTLIMAVKETMVCGFLRERCACVPEFLVVFCSEILILSAHLLPEPFYLAYFRAS